MPDRMPCLSSGNKPNPRQGNPLKEGSKDALISECLPPDSIPRFDINLWVRHVAPTWLY